MNFNKELGQNIKNARKDAGLFQSDLAEVLGLKQPAFSHIENGINALSVEDLCSIAKALNIDLKKLIPKP
jgi:transcriptional regulator with XRE-family HTH domain